MEREADLREQLRYAEQEVSNSIYANVDISKDTTLAIINDDQKSIFSSMSISLVYDSLGYLLTPSRPFTTLMLGNLIHEWYLLFPSQARGLLLALIHTEEQNL